MQKKVHYCNVKFSPEVITQGYDRLKSLLTDKQIEKISSGLTVKIEKETWDHNNDSEFFSEYSRNCKEGYFYKSAEYGEYQLIVSYDDGCSTVTVKAPERHQ